MTIIRDHNKITTIILEYDVFKFDDHYQGSQQNYYNNSIT